MFWNCFSFVFSFVAVVGKFILSFCFVCVFVSFWFRRRCIQAEICIISYQLPVMGHHLDSPFPLTLYRVLIRLVLPIVVPGPEPGPETPVYPLNFCCCNVYILK
jgi:hypothetical protein